MPKKTWLVAATIFSGVALLSVSCLHNSTIESGNRGQSDVYISGSSTVEPISVRVAELLEDSGSKVSVTIDGPGTGDGFKLFCSGATDISDASRQIKDSEAKTCQENGIEWIELQVAIDGMAVITSTNNNTVDCLSFEQLYALIGPEARGNNRWSDANSLLAEMGADGNLPDVALKVFGPGEESGTFDSFVELVIEDIAEDRRQLVNTRPDYTASADDNIIIRGIQDANNSLGWIGFAFAKNASNIRLLSVNNGGGCVAPTSENIATGDYPISRPLFIYVNKAEVASNPAIAEYIDFYLTDEGLRTAVIDSGYVELDSATKNAILQAWKNR